MLEAQLAGRGGDFHDDYTDGSDGTDHSLPTSAFSGGNNSGAGVDTVATRACSNGHRYIEAASEVIVAEDVTGPPLQAADSAAVKLCSPALRMETSASVAGPACVGTERSEVEACHKRMRST
jgi:hypothetical protein